jgi:hypothetical protein
MRVGGVFVSSGPVTDLQWQGDGPVFTIEEDGRPWRLDLDSPHPCVAWSDPHAGARLLELDHVAAVGRRDESAFTGASLVSFERHRGRIQATYAPLHWPGLNVRTAWSPTSDRDGFDLEVQVWSTTTGVYRRLEVAITSRWSRHSTAVPRAGFYSVDPRDVQAAALSYDGREPVEVLRWLLTNPVRDPSPHRWRPAYFRIPGRPAADQRWYNEMVQHNDCARRISGHVVTQEEPAVEVVSNRYGFFGHDLEKGVVLRGRLRGVLLTRPSSPAEIRGRYEAFLSEPPALGP